MAAGEGAHKFPAGYEVYDDDASFGKKAPSLAPLAEKGNWLKGEPVRARREVGARAPEGGR
jgi:hypothetical protein